MINRKIDKYSGTGFLIARFFIVLPFASSLFGHIKNFSGIRFILAFKGIPYTEYILIAGLTILALGSISLLIGYKVKIGCILLALFLLPVTFVIHTNLDNFIKMFSNVMKMLEFMKNFSIFGGLLLVYFIGPGKYSLDEYLNYKSNKKELKGEEILESVSAN